MGSCIGEIIKLSLFGESHFNGVGVVIDGLKSGIKINEEFMEEMMLKRKANDIYSTPRKEEDKVNILSGVYNSYTTGAPLVLFIENKNTRSGDYPKMYRPSHADLTAQYKYNGFQDYRGGGHFSGRLTAPLVAAGSIAIDILKRNNVEIGSHIYSLHNIYDDKINYADLDNYFKKVNADIFPLVNDSKKDLMLEEIKKAKDDLDSVGGVIETVIRLPQGIGEPFFNSVESKLSSYLFSIPAVKGIEFGIGFEFANLKGSEANDQMRIHEGNVEFLTNNNGGINGGITNGAPLVFRLVIKPTPSIMKPQKTIDENFENTILEIKGRHDPCIVRRALPVVNSLAALCLLDLMCINNAIKWMD